MTKIKNKIYILPFLLTSCTIISMDPAEHRLMVYHNPQAKNLFYTEKDVRKSVRKEFGIPSRKKDPFIAIEVKNTSLDKSTYTVVPVKIFFHTQDNSIISNPKIGNFTIGEGFTKYRTKLYKNFVKRPYTFSEYRQYFIDEKIINPDGSHGPESFYYQELCEEEEVNKILYY